LEYYDPNFVICQNFGRGVHFTLKEIISSSSDCGEHGRSGLQVFFKGFVPVNSGLEADLPIFVWTSGGYQEIRE
jgi:hypothetical protein